MFLWVFLHFQKRNFICNSFVIHFNCNRNNIRRNMCSLKSFWQGAFWKIFLNFWHYFKKFIKLIFLLTSLTASFLDRMEPSSPVMLRTQPWLEKREYWTHHKSRERGDDLSLENCGIRSVCRLNSIVSCYLLTAPSIPNVYNKIIRDIFFGNKEQQNHMRKNVVFF